MSTWSSARTPTVDPTRVSDTAPLPVVPMQDFFARDPAGGLEVGADGVGQGDERGKHDLVAGYAECLGQLSFERPLPEDLNAALHEALDKPLWKGDDMVKIVFLVADAPPHLDYQDGPDYAADVRQAAQRGIKIEPIASSGLNDQGEYVFRQLAQLTMGRFTFLTYGADGASPGDSTRHHVSEYAVLALDDLVVRLVADELRPLS